MSQRSDGRRDNRKRPIRENQLDESESPPKRNKASSFDFFFKPITSFIGMFRGGNSEKPQNEREVIDLSNDDDSDGEDLQVVRERHRKQETSGPLIFLNADNQPQARSPRMPAGLEASEAPAAKTPEKHEDIEIVQIVNRTLEVQEDDEEIVIQKTITTVQISDSEESDDVQEIEAPTTSAMLEKTLEVQDDDEIDVQFVKVVNTPNKALIDAKRIAREIIFLNSDAPFDGDRTTTSEFASPTPDDSASRSRTPIDWNQSLPVTSRTPKDFWGRSSRKSTSTSLKKPTAIPKVSTTQRIQKDNFLKPSNTSARQQRLSREKYMSFMISQGYIKQEDVENYDRRNKKKPATSAMDLIGRARNIINASRSTTPAISRESSIIFDRSVAGASTPSSTNESSKNSTHLSEMLTKIEQLDIQNYTAAAHRYQDIYDKTREKEVELREEIRLREEHRAQTREEQQEKVRKRLEIQGVVIRPKLKEKKEEWPPLTEEQAAVVKKAWTNGSPSEVFVESNGIAIARCDLTTLYGLNWLNDNIINFYLQMIAERSKQNGYPKVHAFNTFFYTNVVKKGYASVKRWTRKIDLFAHSIVLIPVHLGLHWCMAIIDFDEKKIEFYDSLYNGNKEVIPALKGYLEAESLDKRKTEFDSNGWLMRQMTKIPRQQNGSDCGVFSCQFGEWASRRKTPEFTQSHMPYYRKRMVAEICNNKLMSSL